MTFSALTIFVMALVAAFVFILGLWAYSTANRLDRLHVRSDLSWHALDAALARRAVVVRAIAAGLGSQGSRRLVNLADHAERAERGEREVAENAVSGALTTIDVELVRPQLVAELADAEARVLIARRFHNDAVRDTLALRTRRPVRWLHLGGTAPLPTYFEITERTTAAAMSEGLTLDTTRTSARVVMLDDEGRVLLLRGHDPADPETFYWFTVGGGVEKGENLRSAAVREIREETGLSVEPAELRGPMWRRVATFSWDSRMIRSEELFFAVDSGAFEPNYDGFTDLERRTVTGHRWCSSGDISDLVESGEAVYPLDLPGLLAEAHSIAQQAGAPEVRSIR